MLKRKVGCDDYVPVASVFYHNYCSGLFLLSMLFSLLSIILCNFLACFVILDYLGVFKFTRCCKLCMQILSELSITTNLQKIRKYEQTRSRTRQTTEASIFPCYYIHIPVYFFYLFGCSHHRVHLISPCVDKWTCSRTALGHTRNYLLSRRDNHVS